MKRLAVTLILLPALLAAEKWKAYRSAPFSVYTTGGEREAQEALNSLVQLRHALSDKFGKDMQPVWPVAVVLSKSGGAPPRLVRETYIAQAPIGPLPPALLERLTLLLLEENTAAMDPAMERGVARVLSTMDCKGPRVTVGAHPAQKDLDWARMHLLLTDVRYSGTPSKVLLSNFAKGVDGDAAWRNTIGSLQREFDLEAKKHLAAGAPGTAALNGRPFDPRRIREEEVEPMEGRLLEADLAGTAEAYKSAIVKFPELHAAKEALGVLTGDKAFLDGAAGPMALAAVHTKESLEKAWKLNPRWSLPHELLAKLEDKHSDKAQRYRKAAELSPRQVRLWRLAAEHFEASELPAEASKMWLAAERAALSQKERDELRETRLAADRKRVDLEEAERRRVEEEQRKELARLKNEAITRIREAEAKANAGAPAPDPDRKVVDWWEGPKPDARVSGAFTRVDCLPGGKLRLVIAGKSLLVRDPGQLVVVGTGTVDLGCGAQRPVRQVTAEYLNKLDKATATIGEAATLQFAAAQ
ncbi:MAG: hypothetical protein FJW30_20015 [Acidobacteria bacterium]|nr:hypothetical protein [Acidobacteriota bacterium]